MTKASVLLMALQIATVAWLLHIVPILHVIAVEGSAWEGADVYMHTVLGVQKVQSAGNQTTSMQVGET